MVRDLPDMDPPRRQILRDAEDLICGDRNLDYGEPADSFQNIADAFNAVTGHNIAADEVAVFHICTKLVRRRASPTKRDTWVDIAGYAGCGFEIATAKNT